MIYVVLCASNTHGRTLITSGKNPSLRSFSVHFSSMLIRADAVPKALRDGKIRHVATLTPPFTHPRAHLQCTSDLCFQRRKPPVSWVLFLSVRHWAYEQGLAFVYCLQESSSHAHSYNCQGGKWPIPISDCEPTVPRDCSKNVVSWSHTFHTFRTLHVC